MLALRGARRLGADRQCLRVQFPFLIAHLALLLDLSGCGSFPFAGICKSRRSEVVHQLLVSIAGDLAQVEEVVDHPAPQQLSSAQPSLTRVFPRAVEIKGSEPLEPSYG